LSIGFVEEDSIRCRYHGWKLDPTGQCVDQPAEKPGLANRGRIRAYPTEEYLGLIFAYLGEGEPPTLPRFAELDAVQGVREVLRPQLWHCNFLQRLDNNDDPVHVPFTHREAYLPGGRPPSLPRVARRESEWGLTSQVTFPGGGFHSFEFGMPNVYYFKLTTPSPELAWDERIQWMVPIDDEHVTEFRVRLLPVTGEAAQRYLAMRLPQLETEGLRVPEWGEAMLAGKLWLEDLQAEATPIEIVDVQDYITQVGQGRIHDRGQERLGQSDSGVIVFRRIWERELRALAEGRSLKQWHRPPGMVPRFDYAQPARS
jgi:5,5'-dehydrodivanillate O-demethylase